MEVKFKKIDKNAVTPKYGTEDSAGADLYVLLNTEKVEIKPHETVMLNTGIATQIPKGYVGLIAARSGIASKQGLAPANKLGVIDSDYTGEIKVPLHNHTEEVQIIYDKTRVAQLIIAPYIHADFNEVENLDNTERGAGGFGSTGTN